MALGTLGMLGTLTMELTILVFGPHLAGMSVVQRHDAIRVCGTDDGVCDDSGQ